MRALLILLSFLFVNLSMARDKVIVGAYVNDIQNLELNSHSYTVDFYVWFKWENKEIDPSESMEFMNAFDRWGHTHTKSYEKPILLKNGFYYQSVRVQGRFSHKFQLMNYPFDKGELLVDIEDSEAEKNSIFYVLDDVDPITMNPDLKFPGFIVGKPKLSIVSKAYPTSFGISEFGEKTEYHRVRLEIPILRPVMTYLVKLMLPILCVVFSTSLMFLFNPKYIDSRVGIGITSLLTIVALQLTLNDELPEIDYLVLLDKIYIVTYLFVVFGLGIVVAGSWILEKGEENLAKVIQIDRVSLGILLMLYLITSSLLIITAMASR